jgi:hypothetical protein
MERRRDVMSKQFNSYRIEYSLYGEQCQVVLFNHRLAGQTLRDLMDRGAVGITVVGPSQFGGEFRSLMSEQDVETVERIEALEASNAVIIKEAL